VDWAEIEASVPRNSESDILEQARKTNLVQCTLKRKREYLSPPTFQAVLVPLARPVNPNQA